MSAPEKKQITYDNISYPYFEYHGDKQRTIVMVHGFRGTHDGLDLIAQALPEYRIIVPDLPGFGESPALVDRSHTLESYRDFVAALIRETTDTPPILLGHSFGSIVVSAVAAAYPQTIQKLILINPIGAPALEGPKAILTRIALFYYRLGTILPGRAGKAWLSTQTSSDAMSHIMTKSGDTVMKRFIIDQHRQYFSSFANTKVVREAFHTSVTHTVREFAAAIKTPTLMIVGEKDDITPLARQQELVELFDDAQLEIIMGTGHLVHYETPSEAAELIQRFLK